MSRTPLESPMRSLLFVPGHDARMIDKALGSGADAIIADLEDAVPGSTKVEARATVGQALRKIRRANPLVFVRINKTASGYSGPDVDCTASPDLHGFVLPKCESPQAIGELCKRLERKERLLKIPRRTFQLILLVETALGLVRLPELIGCNSRVLAIAFGAEDFCLDTQIKRTSGDQELLYARSRLSIFARAFGCMAFDSVFTDLKNPKGLLVEATQAKNLGFRGKLAIHPEQIGPIHRAFAPSREELVRAQRIINAFARAEKEGRAVCLVAGKMIDRPMVERARRIVASAG